jgi:hypothetical protein
MVVQPHPPAAHPLLQRSLLRAAHLLVVDPVHLTQSQVAMEQQSHPLDLEPQLPDMDLVRAWRLLH